MKPLLLVAFLLSLAFTPQAVRAQQAAVDLELVLVVSPSSGSFLVQGQSYPVTFRIRNNSTSNYNNLATYTFLVGSNPVVTQETTLSIAAGETKDVTLNGQFAWNDTSTKFGTAFVEGNFSNDPDMGNNTKTVTYNGFTLSVSDVLAHQFQINAYPSVASQVLTFQANQSPKRLRLVSMMGQEVRRITSQSNEIRLDVSNVAPGIYFLQAEYAQGTWTKRIVINR
jgi:hypothetical protein